MSVRSSSENCFFIDLNHTSKQRVHVRELTHLAREFCLKRAVNYISKGHGAIKPCFKLRWQWGERPRDFFQSFVCCSLSVFRSSSENYLFIDLSHTSKQHVHVRELTHQFLRGNSHSEPTATYTSAKKGGNFGAKLTHLFEISLDVSFFFVRKKTSFAILISQNLCAYENLRRSFSVSIP